MSRHRLRYEGEEEETVGGETVIDSLSEEEEAAEDYT